MSEIVRRPHRLHQKTSTTAKTTTAKTKKTTTTKTTGARSPSRDQRARTSRRAASTVDAKVTGERRHPTSGFRRARSTGKGDHGLSLLALKRLQFRAFTKEGDADGRGVVRGVLRDDGGGADAGRKRSPSYPRIVICRSQNELGNNDNDKEEDNYNDHRPPRRRHGFKRARGSTKPWKLRLATQTTATPTSSPEGVERVVLPPSVVKGTAIATPQPVVETERISTAPSGAPSPLEAPLVSDESEAAYAAQRPVWISSFPALTAETIDLAATQVQRRRSGTAPAVAPIDDDAASKRIQILAPEISQIRRSLMTDDKDGVASDSDDVGDEKNNWPAPMKEKGGDPGSSLEPAGAESDEENPEAVGGEGGHETPVAPPMSPGDGLFPPEGRLLSIDRPDLLITAEGVGSEAKKKLKHRRKSQSFAEILGRLRLPSLVCATQAANGVVAAGSTSSPATSVVRSPSGQVYSLFPLHQVHSLILEGLQQRATHSLRSKLDRSSLQTLSISEASDSVNSAASSNSIASLNSINCKISRTKTHEPKKNVDSVKSATAGKKKGKLYKRTESSKRCMVTNRRPGGGGLPGVQSRCGDVEIGDSDGPQLPMTISSWGARSKREGESLRTGSANRRDSARDRRSNKDGVDKNAEYKKESKRKGMKKEKRGKKSDEENDDDADDEDEEEDKRREGDEKEEGEDKTEVGDEAEEKRAKEEGRRRKGGRIASCKSTATWRSEEEEEEEEDDGGSGGSANEKPKMKGVSLLTAIRPANQDSEKERFMRANFHYNPQFVYQYEIPANLLAKFDTPSDRYLPQAVKIMQNAIKKYGNYEEFERQTGGRSLNRGQIVNKVKRYLEREGVEDEIVLNLCDDILCRGSMMRIKGKPTLSINTSTPEHWIEGLLRHEVGTHFLRSRNNSFQPWANPKRRRELDLLPANPTEEGLASLHSVLFRRDPCLWRSALLYYAAYQAARMSFADLFRDLCRYVRDPFVRWDYCMRAKRGQYDTSINGAFCKDQVYLEGALQLLKHRRSIDFHFLVQLGKVAFEDVDRLLLLADCENAQVPSFMQDEELYRRRLDYIVLSNGLSDDELERLPDSDGIKKAQVAAAAQAQAQAQIAQAQMMIERHAETKRTRGRKTAATAASS